MKKILSYLYPFLIAIYPVLALRNYNRSRAAIAQHVAHILFDLATLLIVLISSNIYSLYTSSNLPIILSNNIRKLSRAFFLVPIRPTFNSRACAYVWQQPEYQKSTFLIPLAEMQSDY